ASDRVRAGEADRAASACRARVHPTGPAPESLARSSNAQADRVAGHRRRRRESWEQRASWLHRRRAERRAGPRLSRIVTSVAAGNDWLQHARLMDPTGRTMCIKDAFAAEATKRYQ